ncbi:crossover junction endonuclease EME1 isoform X2 [Bicyclus anynana]|uniref:Crossover junction endonuclease EME1 isoform X2 n=1 Tax=Bicyclus anynana TaxID=110368 RepID=A0ABM3LIN4_BICAN|nr:crossover junction endonuclease EME1 isoform X2 [Bicyclus anynana]
MEIKDLNYCNMNTNTIEISSDDSDDDHKNENRYLPKPDTSPMEEDSSSSSSSSSSSEDSEDSVFPSTSQTTTVTKSSQESRSSKTRKTKSRNSENKKISAAERQALKKKMAVERKAAKDANKVYKPGECMKHMTIEMHPVLLESWYCADVAREAAASGVKVRASSAICDPSLVLWTRTVPPTLTNNDGMMELSAPRMPCERALYVQRLDDAAPLVAARSLADSARQARALAGCPLTLVLYGVKDYFKKSGRKTVNSSNKIISEKDLEEAITDVLVSAACDTVRADTPNELALTIVRFTKAVAETPYKKARRAVDERAEFYMRGDNKKCVAVDKDGNGLGRLWQQMLAVLPMASLESSRALCARYRSPLALFETLLAPGGVAAVADVGVTRAAAPGSKARRIGPEFARKLELLFTATDGSTLID